MTCRQPSRPVLQTFRPVPDDYEVMGGFAADDSSEDGDIQPGVMYIGTVGLLELGGGGGGKGVGMEEEPP